CQHSYGTLTWAF
nr:immunoglobulin light chain junction region [Macaca mulatta]MOV83219.1 immunoglobulin light chain junction region [Macaca mulatta]MOV83495.1 immunoglobulin light chain junction region [Macaca mulatta]